MVRAHSSGGRGGVASAMQKKISRWWQRADLNRRPKAYESSALPLSYSAIVRFRHLVEQRARRLYESSDFVQ